MVGGDADRHTSTMPVGGFAPPTGVVVSRKSTRPSIAVQEARLTHAMPIDRSSGGDPFRRPYLSTHPAVAAAQREFTRLGDELVRHVAALGEPEGVKAEVRRSPSRCIVQLGPVAATVAWLRGADSVTESQLMLVVWRGRVAPSATHQFERPVARPEAVATAVWEGAYVADAESEATWGWQSQLADASRCTSGELVARCLEKLRLEWQQA